MSATPTTSSTSTASVLQLLRVEREMLDELQRRAPLLTGSEVRYRLEAARRRLEELDRQLR